MTTPRPKSVNRWLEPLLALLTVGGLVRALIHLYTEGYLPQPYFYDPYDLWMDWFNTAWWAHDPGMYDSWASAYPPLSFVLVKLFSLPGCYRGLGPYAYGARSCDWLALLTLHAFYAANIMLGARLFLKLDRRTALPRSLVFALGLPMTGGLERGNLIMPTITFFLLAFGPFLRSARLRWLFAGMCVNMKVYLIAAILPGLLHRRWRWVEGALIATLLVYVATFGLLGRGSPGEILTNLIDYTTGGSTTNFLDAWFAATYSALLDLMGSNEVPIMSMIGQRSVDAALFWIPLAVRVTQAAIMLAAAGIWLRPEAVSRHRSIALGLLLALITAESGGYTLIFFVLFAFMERWRGIAAKVAIISAYVVSLPFDLILDRAPPVWRDTYIGNQTLIVEFYIMLGPFVRPALALLIALCIACATITDVWKDIGRQGWRKRWRFRRDLPIMVGDGNAIPPGRGTSDGHRIANAGAAP